MIRNFLVFFLPMFWLFDANASSVHLGLKINYQNAMSHVEKKDMPIVLSIKKISEALPHSRFLISGHTDIVGSYEVNIELSKGRAENLKNLLINLGVDPSRIQTKWFSFDAPIATNETKEGRNKNRRVVVTFYGLNEKEAQSLARVAERSNKFYVIKIENELVDKYVKDVLTPEIPPPQVVTKTQEEIDAELKLQKQKEDELLAQQKKEAEDLLLKQKKEEEERLLKQRLAEEELLLKKKKEEEDLALQKKKEEEKLLKQQQKAEARKLRAEKWAAFKEKQRYQLSYEVSDNELQAESSGFEAIWVTDFNHGLSGSYQFNFIPKLWIGLSGSYKFRDFREDDNQIYNWDGNSPSLLSLAVISDYEFSPKFNFGFDIKYFEENFIIYQGLDINLDKASLLGLGLRADYKFFNTDKYSSRFKFMIENPILGFGDLDPSGSLSFYGGVDFSLHKLIKNYELNLGMVYGIRNFENVQNKQTENYFGFEIKFRSKKWF